MGVFDSLSKVFDQVDRAVDTVQKVSAAVPKVRAAAKQLQQSLEAANTAARQMQDAVAPIVEAVAPAPFPPDVIEAAGLLGLALPITKAQLDAAYKAAALRAHPDKGGSVTRMKAINAARNVLRPWCRIE